MLFICYPKCSTCKKAKKWLDEHNVEYTERHIVENNPTYDELKEWSVGEEAINRSQRESGKD